MKLIRNSGSDRVFDCLEDTMLQAVSVDIATSRLLLHGFAALQSKKLIPNKSRIVVALGDGSEPQPKGDRSYRNGLRERYLSAVLVRWLKTIEVRATTRTLSQSAIIGNNAEAGPIIAMVGDCSLSTEGLGLAASDRLGMVQLAETEDERAMFAKWFIEQWQTLPQDETNLRNLLFPIEAAANRRGVADIYHRVLDSLFEDMGEGFDEDRIVKSATGIRDTLVWSKLYKFQRDGAVGAIDKLQRYGGCILADSVGLGKTFEALAVIKYHELRNERVLVLAPKRLRDNWTLWKANDRRNPLAGDRFNYDVLNHTDLSRDGGLSGDIDLNNINWGNYDLIVIDESHNFRNRPSGKDHDTRYDRLMARIIRAGVKTRVLMLSATPVNNGLNDLKNQIAFATEGNDTALAAHNIQSVDGTIRFAQGQFTRWLKLPDEGRTSERLLDMLGFDYFRLLDLLTIARSRRHVEKYYGTAETGRFPERRAPLNIKADIDTEHHFPQMGDINSEIRRLTLAAYAPLRYVLPARAAAYDRAYNQQVQGGQSVFRQLDREESLVALMRINLLKRMESSVHSFALTVERQLASVSDLIARIDAHVESIDEPVMEDLDLDDPMFEALSVGKRVRVLLADADRVRWRQDLVDDQSRLQSLLDDARQVTPQRDAKLRALSDYIADKTAKPFNEGNRKVIVFTAFADTAKYIYEALGGKFGLDAALVTGSGGNKTTMKGIRVDLSTILTAFAPLSKSRAPEFADEGEIDLLIATDCISEGQNLQDCDCLINYDIHWNPVRIVQRFGRIDRIGSPNSEIQLVNFWPNMDLDSYIGLERKVSGRMKLLDISATGEENIIEAQSGDQMNDLDYRRRQMEVMQTTVIDLEDLSSGVSIADLTLNDLRIDLARVSADDRAALKALPFTVHSVVESRESVPAGAIFVLRAETTAALACIPVGDPLRPHALVHIGTDGTVLLGPAQAKRILDRLKLLSADGGEIDERAWDRFDAATGKGNRMGDWSELLGKAIAAVTGKADERAVASLFTSGGTQGTGGFAGIDDWEVVAWVAVI
jgi:hypothetical protein